VSVVAEDGGIGLKARGGSERAGKCGGELRRGVFCSPSLSAQWQR